MALGRGQAVEELAARSGRSVATLRSQGKAIFAKTGVQRQSDLRAVLARVDGAPEAGA